MILLFIIIMSVVLPISIIHDNWELVKEICVILLIVFCFVHFVHVQIFLTSSADITAESANKKGQP